MNLLKRRCHWLIAIAQFAGAVGCAYSQIFCRCRKRAYCFSADSWVDFAGDPVGFFWSAGDYREGRHPDQIRTQMAGKSCSGHQSAYILAAARRGDAEPIGRYLRRSD